MIRISFCKLEIMKPRRLNNMANFLSFIITLAIFMRIMAWILKPFIKPVLGTAGIIALIVYLVRRFKK